MPVTVEGQRFAFPLKIGSGRFAIGKEGFVRNKQQLHQPPGRIIDEHQQGTAFASLFEPGMIRAIDLDQLSITGSPLSHLVDRFLLLAPHFPQPFLHHDLAHTLPRDPDPLHFHDLFMRQRRSKI